MTLSLTKAKLILEDNSIFEGYSFASKTPVSGEVVFNTGMVGYPETLTDPSYKGQILAFTYPLIGNYGVPPHEKEKGTGLLKFFESDKIQISGLIVSEYSMQHNHWNSKQSLQGWLSSEKIPAITGIDTRALTKKLREKGTMLGKIVFENGKVAEKGKNKDKEKLTEKNIGGFYDPNKENLFEKVSPKKPIVYGDFRKKIAFMDCGAKNNIIRSLLKRKISVIRFPWNYDIFNKKFKFDMVFVSNGPGDPKMATKTIETVKKSMELGMPTVGICLGNQILALASGANTYKLKYGHRSQNQPAVLAGTSKCFITSQNHGFAVDKKTLPKNWSEWFYNANDGTNEGIKHNSKPFMSVQFHPEATPGPVDTDFLFDKFVELIKER